MIGGFDHVVIAVTDLAAGVPAYEKLLGAEAIMQRGEDNAGAALITTSNIAVELMAPVGDSEGAVRLRAALADGEGLKSMVFAVADIEHAHRRCERVGLAPEVISDREAWRSFRANTERTHGVRLFFIQREAPLTSAAGAGVLGLDHIVIRTPDPERAAALYGARLGLGMRLDREVMGRRLMFFRCGDAVVEIVHDSAMTDGSDKLWGVSWRVANAEAAHARLAAAGLDVSEVRAGAKPGTRVFTVRDGTCGVPTLMIEPSPKRD